MCRRIAPGAAAPMASRDDRAQLSEQARIENGLLGGLNMPERALRACGAIG
jgi:hypothetical protein